MMVSGGLFREDLYYRLNVIPLRLPTLVERAEDTEILTDYFIRKIAGEMNKPPIGISREAVDKLLAHRWPGNVRELENTLKRGIALCTSDRLEADDIIFIATDKSGQTSAEHVTKTTLTLKGNFWIPASGH